MMIYMSLPNTEVRKYYVADDWSKTWAQEMQNYKIERLSPIGHKLFVNDLFNWISLIISNTCII